MPSMECKRWSSACSVAIATFQEQIQFQGTLVDLHELERELEHVEDEGLDAGLEQVVE